MGMRGRGGGRFWLEKGTDHIYIFFFGGGDTFLYIFYIKCQRRDQNK